MESTIPVNSISSYTNPTLAIRELRAYTKHLLGRTLTIIDAAIPAGPQNKATKDLLHSAFWQEHYTPAKDWCEVATANVGAQIIECFPFDDDVRGASSPSVTFTLPSTNA